ncbi:hypothetical protein [Klebsiella pneumoniae]|uniref:hypothetical protein n=1 Tax=Klebsiella pneumoniae TaxID=573 RepID=UPI00202E980D|nr:hypothetical protein [Klebsiella pneumoniae]MCM0764437.1 hypothetical protein [Klebsiella pneumoniae]MCM0769988.1 hypothetical protein [Klebsiella pneumoniae]MCM0777145.1 hypothetical protein [Klebsiella pneumoniae]MCM0801065.1 hypothetical protein [Klebsiella pneumoniae]MCM0899906.1 hypothetical protein [Klebsiella pneumoniae]
MSHKKEHTVMVNKVLRELARQQGQTVKAVLEQLFCRASIVKTGLLNEAFREAFQQHYSGKPFNHVTWCPFCQCFDLTQRSDPMVQGEACWTFSSTQF